MSMLNAQIKSKLQHPQPGRKPQAFELLKIESFKFSAPRAKMVFKCPTLSSDFVCQMPLLKINRRHFLSLMKLGYDHGTQRTRIQREIWKQTLQGKPCAMCFWQTARKSPRILRFLAIFFPFGAWTSIIVPWLFATMEARKGRSAWVEITIAKLKVRERFWSLWLRRLVKKLLWM